MSSLSPQFANQYSLPAILGRLFLFFLLIVAIWALVAFVDESKSSVFSGSFLLVEGQPLTNHLSG